MCADLMLWESHKEHKEHTKGHKEKEAIFFSDPCFLFVPLCVFFVLFVADSDENSRYSRPRLRDG